MKNLIQCTCGDRFMPYASLALRLAAGLIFVMHGWQKLERGTAQTAAFLGFLGFPAPAVFAVILIAIEIGGGALLILGLYTHWVAKLLALVALIAFVTVHASKGFFVGDGGYEFIVLIFAAVLSLMITGPGRWSLDALLRRK
ncbi:MAG TPA: DoxX family protein [Candidatus Paceibacterota bacterium]|nr:DoxX family protein [Candidatus Paceibacterota bacterium]